MLRLVRALLTVVGTAFGVVLLGAVLETASACPGAGISCPPPQTDGRTVTVTVSGTFVNPGSDGSSGGSTTVSVPVPCYLTSSWTGKEYFDGIEDGSITGAGWDEWADRPWAPYPGYRQHKDDTEGQWWVPTCRWTDEFEEFEDWDTFSVDYFLTYPHVFLDPGEQPPVPPVPPEILLEAAQQVMEVPEPEFEHNPDVAGTFDTLVNLDTWFWLTDPTQAGDVTASAGGNSVTVEATLTDVTFSAPDAGEVACEGTGTEWSAGASSECALAFGSAGTSEVTADTQWAVAWSYNGEPQGPIDPLVATFTQGVGVAESQALVTRVD